MAIRDLPALLRDAAPVLDGRRFSIRCVADAPPALTERFFALIREREGWTVIEADANGDWALITMTVPSDLQAVGFTAAFAQALAALSIPANVVAGFHHDHILLPWDRRDDAMTALAALEETAH